MLSSIVPERPGYEFVGWAESAGSERAEYKSGDRFDKNASQTLYAVWQYVGFTLNFYSENGELIATQRYNKGDTVKAPEAPIKDGDLLYRYEFSGWSPSLPEEVSGDANFTATYKKISIFETTEKEEESETVPEMSAPPDVSIGEQGSAETDTEAAAPEESAPQTDGESAVPVAPDEKPQKSAGAASLAAGLAALTVTLVTAFFIKKRN